jgi:hypothetical protein
VCKLTKGMQGPKPKKLYRYRQISNATHGQFGKQAGGIPNVVAKKCKWAPFIKKTDKLSSDLSSYRANT